MRVSFCWVSCALLSACGGSGQTAVGSSGSAGAAGLSAGGTSGNSAGGGAGASGSGAGGSSGAAGSAGSGPAGSCGPFGAPEALFASPDILSSVSITGDDLELFYYVDNRVFVSKRATVADAFMDATEVTELASLCVDGIGPSLDVTADGLRLYIDCADGATELYLAERPNRTSQFSVGPEPVGMTGTSISLSPDELTAYTSTSDAQNWQPMMHVRASTAEPFGDEMPIPGLVGPFRMLELANDGRSLFGVLARPEAPTVWRLGVATRSTESGPSFSPPVTDGLRDPTIFGGTVSDYTPTLNATCTALYFMSLTSDPDAGTVTSTIFVMRQQ